VSIPEHPATALPPLPMGLEPTIELSGQIAPDLVEYLREKVAAVLGHTGRAPMHAHVRVVRHADPARERPVTARASVRLAGATVHAHVEAETARAAADRLIDRLDQRIARLSRTRRGDRASARAAHGEAPTTPTSGEGRRRMLPVPPDTD
jgi:ribosome-associated translation inhibitor RaiA